MIEITIHGRGGQGGVTLAKLIATAGFLQGRHAQAFGVYAAERSGAPLQAYVRIDDAEIVNHNQVRTPDHVVVLDRALLGPQVLAGHRADGWVVLNTSEPHAALPAAFDGRQVAIIDATAIAIEHGLGTRAVPIVNTTMFGAVGRVLGFDWPALQAALEETHFGGANLTAAQRAFEQVRCAQRPGQAQPVPRPAAPARVAGLLDEEVGARPRIRTGTWASRSPQRRDLEAPCAHACPAGNDIRAFVAAIGERHYDDALSILLETTPLPGTCGRVCPAPCMESCNRSALDEAVEIRALERYAAEHGIRPRPTSPWRDESVAVVGSGPAGLSAAYHLARLGYRVTIYESGHELGGLLRSGIPEYRLPRAVLDAEIEGILAHGVEVARGAFVDRAALLDLSRRHSAVFIATGLQTLSGLNLGADAEDVIQGIAFLDLARLGKIDVRRQRVAVVGGGNTAIDAARTALRLGARSVQILYRRTRAEMPAIHEEIEEALAEGVTLSELVAPLALRRQRGQAVLTCARMELGPADASGRPRPVPQTGEDAQFELVCDRVILALGQSADVSILPEGAEVYEGAALLGLAGAPIFAGGDLATNEGTVAHAIGSGRRAAWHIHRTLTGVDLFPPPPQGVATREVMHLHGFERSTAARPYELPPAVRRRSFSEVRLGLLEEPGEELAAAEAARCFHCGACNECDRCVRYCPEGILVRDGDGYRFDYDYCKGCGICAAECPRGVIYMTELQGRTASPARGESREAACRAQ